MADIELVIKIPDTTYEGILNSDKAGGSWGNDLLGVLCAGMANGTPLPKEHGRLGDLSKIYIELNEAQIEGTEEYKGLGKAKQILCNAPTIIEADIESEDKE